MYSLVINLLRFTNNIFRKLGFEIKKYNKEINEIRKLRKKLIKKSPIIFDVGANVGQSIDRFLVDFKEAQIHSFEPNNEAFQILKEKYSKHKNIFLNNFALGETKKKKILNCTLKSGNSSFYNLNINSDWIKEKAEVFNVKIKEYVKKNK